MLVIVISLPAFCCGSIVMDRYGIIPGVAVFLTIMFSAVVMEGVIRWCRTFLAQKGGRCSRGADTARLPP